MNHTLKNLLALLLFIISLTFLFAATSMQNKADFLLVGGDCHHCHSQFTCEVGGQAYGWDDCFYDETQTPPNNCSPIGGSNCGAGSDPGESD